ncbi:MAG: biotin--[acetyl-CoA-carboxylase] ligase [Betaproteobacteria bacterium]|nr:biotin--[acetyl-CoA-carboxylase] ligase [Betaproteobacteria bacterium]
MPLLDPARLKDRLGPFAGRFDVDALDLCDSTSSELMRRSARNVPSGSVVVADRQSAGRGRRGRSWLSDPDAGLTFSLLWKFAGPPARLAGLSLAVGVALALALEDLGVAGVRLKWPNDVLLGEAKLAGVLVELASDRQGVQAVIGIGLNLRAPVAAGLDRPAAGLEAVLLPVPDRHDVLAALLVRLAGVFDAFAVDGFAGQKSAWMARHAWQDQPVSVAAEGESPRAGTCRGVDDDGALLLDTASGWVRIYAGDVSLRRA